MPFNDLCKMFFYWFGFSCFFCLCAVGVLILYHYIEFKIKNRPAKRKNPIKETYEILNYANKNTTQKN